MKLTGDPYHGLSGNAWMPGLTIPTSEGNVYYVPADVLTSGTQNQADEPGSWFQPVRGKTIYDMISGGELKATQVPDSWGKESLAFGWSNVDNPNTGYILNQDQYDRIFSNTGSTGWSSLPNSGEFANLKLTSSGNYAAGGGDWSTSVGDSGYATTNRVTSDGLFGGVLGDLVSGIGGFINDLGPIGQIGLTMLNPLGAAIGNAVGKTISGQDLGFGDLARFAIPAAQELGYVPTFSWQDNAAALPADQIGAMNAGGDMDFFDTLDSLLQGGYTNEDAWTMAEQLTGGADIGSQVSSFVGGEAAGASLFSQAADLAKQLGITPARAVSALLQGGGGLLNASAAKSAAQNTADAQVRAAQIAADAAKFRPVGVTTRFGSSNFEFDPITGYLKSAGYTLSPEMKALQDQAMASTGGLLSQFTGAKGATAPMGTAAQRAMTLGNQYLAADPQAQAKMFMDQQQALLAGSREQQLASLQNKLAQQGRLGLATGATSTGMMATNPEMAAYQNAIQQQNLQLAANATQGGMDYAKFGAGMVGTGSDLLKGMYGTQTAAYSPFQTALGGAQAIEGLGQNAMTQGMSLGSTATAANAQAGSLLSHGMTNAANTTAATNAYSPWGALLSGAGGLLNQYAQPQQQQPIQLVFNPNAGGRL